MLHLATGTVIRVLERQTGMQVLEVKLSRQEAGSLQTQKAISFAREEYSLGDNLLLNTTALQLQLGTGGFHLVVGKRRRGSRL